MLNCLGQMTWKSQLAAQQCAVLRSKMSADPDIAAAKKMDHRHEKHSSSEKERCRSSRKKCSSSSKDRHSKSKRSDRSREKCACR